MDDSIAAFHKVATLDRSTVFGATDRPPISDKGNAYTAAPGWVGERWAGDLLLIANFPGGGGDGYVGNPTDAGLYGAFRDFRNSSPGHDRHAAFSRMCRTYREAERTHNLWRNVIRPTLEALDIGEQQAAFINLVPFRIRENKAPRVSERLMAWNAGVSGQVAALDPRQIVALGVAAGEALVRLMGHRPKIEIIPRTNGDHYLSREAQLVLERLRADRSAKA